jgi:hypothetical protein
MGIGCSQICISPQANLDTGSIEPQQKYKIEHTIQHSATFAVSTKSSFKKSNSIGEKKLSYVLKKVIFQASIRRLKVSIRYWRDISYALWKQNCPVLKFDKELAKLGRIVDERQMTALTSKKILGIESSVKLSTGNVNKEEGLFIRDCFKYYSDVGVVNGSEWVGDIYKGSWNKDLERHGYGVLVMKDGSKYEGMFENNKLSGQGVYYDTEGNYYKGNIFCN